MEQTCTCINPIHLPRFSMQLFLSLSISNPEVGFRRGFAYFLLMIETIALGLIVAAASFLQGLTGFGFALIALPLLSLLIPLKTAVPLLIMLALVISAYLSYQLRHDIRFKTIKVLFLSTLPAIPLGSYALAHFPSQPLSIIVGLLMVSFTSFQFLYKPAPKQLGVVPTALSGFISGLLAASIGAGGPPVIVYTAIQGWSKNETKSTLAFYFTLIGFLVLTTHAWNGLVTPRVINLFLATFPAMLIGMWGGTWAYKHLSDHGYKKIALAIVFVLGWMMLWENI